MSDDDDEDDDDDDALPARYRTTHLRAASPQPPIGRPARDAQGEHPGSKRFGLGGYLQYSSCLGCRVCIGEGFPGELASAGASQSQGWL